MVSRRITNLGGVAVCVGLLVYAYMLQFIDGLEPCPLCVFQRVAFFVLGSVFLIAALHNPGTTGARVYGGLIALAAGTGAAIAGRHIWLQSLPADQVPECGPGLEYMLDTFPLVETLRTVLSGSGECADISWLFLGMTIPAWALLWFVALGLIGVARNFIAHP